MDKFNKDNPYDDIYENEEVDKYKINKKVDTTVERLSISEIMEKLEKFIREKDNIAVEKFNTTPSLTGAMDRAFLKGKVEAYREVYEYLGIINSFR